MNIIDADKFLTYLIFSKHVDGLTCGEVKEAIEMCTIKDIYTKADMIAMLTGLQTEMEKYEARWAENDEQAAASCRTWEDLDEIIQQKINSLKACEKMTREEEAVAYLKEERDSTLKDLDIWDTEEGKKEAIKYADTLEIAIKALSSLEKPKRMTREEAIKKLSCIADEMPSMECADWIEAINMAIKALEQ